MADLGFKTKINLGLGVPPTRFAGPKIPHLICIKFPELGRHILYFAQVLLQYEILQELAFCFF